jgi:hypothetical protein
MLNNFGLLVKVGVILGLLVKVGVILGLFDMFSLGCFQFGFLKGW